MHLYDFQRRSYICEYRGLEIFLIFFLGGGIKAVSLSWADNLMVIMLFIGKKIPKSKVCGKKKNRE